MANRFLLLLLIETIDWTQMHTFIKYTIYSGLKDTFLQDFEGIFEDFVAC